jgi:hypothetical protein
MMKRNLGFTIIVLLVAVALALLWPGRLMAQENEAKPTLVPLKVQTPAPTPPDGREVAILTLVIKSGGEGKLEAIDLETARIIRSYAPNVLNRGGQWTVEVEGVEGLRFGVQDPRWREAFPEKEGAPFENEILSQVVWELVVPLYLFDQDIQAQVINLYDEQGERIFTTEVDRERWK